MNVKRLNCLTIFFFLSSFSFSITVIMALNKIVYTILQIFVSTRINIFHNLQFILNFGWRSSMLNEIENSIAVTAIAPAFAMTVQCSLCRVESGFIV